ncbi:early nodulin-like protein 9 [Salvia miltiorrhiza]|uniref:early nodulin-like protein 9 n=1 Tax=Salvia miltiorrhiza TaxID=226208 RepID=UPI0025AD4C8C|nr:early nodulin-like protein 9 [Salvia miltiorrhiza]
MASTNQRVLSLLSVLLLILQRCHAFEFKVGGSQGWAVPTDAALFNHWAEKARFQIGDSLLFVYSSDHDSVLHVSKEDYASCSADKPLDKFTDGHTVYKLDQSGPHYFISGVAENCHKNEKLIVVVMADRSNKTAAAPSPSEGMSPPSPAPAGEESPPPPPAEETNPTPAPSEESSPAKNAASSVASAVVGTVAVLFGSSFALAL